MLVPSIAFRYHSPSINVTTIAHPSDGWILYVRGWFFQRNPLRELLGTAILSIVVDGVDHRRVSDFTASGIPSQALCVNGLKHKTCAVTDSDGLIKTHFQVSNREIEQFLVPGGNGGKVEYSVSTPDKALQAIGEIFLCDDNGISIISDIDDTIKITGVTSVDAVLQNTFSGEYKAVPGMPERYRHYASYYNATFHYLTASPDQLYPFLREFFDREKFPLGSYHMRHFTWFDSNFIEFFQSKSFIKEKTHVLKMFFNNTRSRKFILFGDIFQKDPEIYGDIYKTYSKRILKIFIRVSNKTIPNRLNQVFDHIPKHKWAMFLNGYDLPDTIFYK